MELLGAQRRTRANTGEHGGLIRLKGRPLKRMSGCTRSATEGGFPLSELPLEARAEAPAPQRVHFAFLQRIAAVRLVVAVAAGAPQYAVFTCDWIDIA
jgi:hypothetical protein